MISPEDGRDSPIAFPSTDGPKKKEQRSSAAPVLRMIIRDRSAATPTRGGRGQAKHARTAAEAAGSGMAVKVTKPLEPKAAE